MAERLAALALTVAFGLTGCGGGRAASAPAANAPAPADPDLGTVMERFYGDVEGGHWAIAYAMLSPRYRRTVSRADLEARYVPLADLDVTLRQRDSRTVVAALTARERADRGRTRRVEETWTLAWDGADWTLDAMRRRER